MAERQFGPYRLVRQIAVGGMAEIHLAKASGIAGFEKYVALKMIHPNFAEDEQFIQMLVDEAKIAVQLTHGNIAQTFDLGRVGETYYITMEYVDGADLYKVLRRASEQDLVMPLDVCAFVGKEIASALDHAHRKRDHVGKPLGIVHRDVSPQNVLISYAGEVKLVDFGIAKATMKARQTAVGVIKGKYYYMSPEQAWGDPIDYRSDIFSAGIVLYEMITGQMLYLEEDLHRLLDMARKADIAPPSKLRKGVPPQLERIVMHALQRGAGERYQSAGDFATDLERFLHAYSPVFTAGKIAALIRQVLGDPVPVAPAPAPDVEQRGGVFATQPLDDADLAHASDMDNLRDENSVIFRVAELRPPAAPAVPPPVPSRKREPDEETRELGRPGVAPWEVDEGTDTSDDLDGIAERTVVTKHAFLVDGADGIEATLVTQPPVGVEVEESESDVETNELARLPREEESTIDREPPTVQRPSRGRNTAPPPALAAKIHAPAVSELRKPRPSRRTPPGGTPAQQPNVLQQIVSSRPSEPMPAPVQAVAAPSPPSMVHVTDASGLPLGLPTPPHGQPYYAPPGSPYPGYPVQPAALYGYGQGPPQAPVPTTLTGQMRLFEVDDLPPQYRLQSRRRRMIGYGFAAVLAVSLAALATFLIIRAMRERTQVAALGSIRVESVPPGADVFLDGQHVPGRTPLTIEKVPTGARHEVRVELAKHKPAVESVDVGDDGGTMSLQVVLPPVLGRLVINSRPGGAEIRIDGEPRGRTPGKIEDLDMGSTRKLELRLKDFQPHIQDLVWPTSGQIELDVALVK
jgi:eukaryotic-like serine/threonine-protein kinase